MVQISEADKYDFFLPVGPHCRPAMYLRRYGLRTVSSPLDWMMRYSLETEALLFRTAFQSFFRECTEIEERTMSDETLLAEKTRWVVDEINQITSVHHFSTDRPLAEQKEDFWNRMDKRFRRTDLLLEQADRVALVGAWEAQPEMQEEFLVQFGSLYPTTAFTFINMRNQKDAPEVRIRKRSVTSRLELVEYEFSNQSCERPFRQDKTWDSVLMALWLKHDPFIAKVKNLLEGPAGMDGIYIYGAGVYGRSAVRLLSKYGLTVKAVLVSSLANNPTHIGEFAVMQVDEAAKALKDNIAIIAVSDQCSHQAAKERLKQEKSSILRKRPLSMAYRTA